MEINLPTRPPTGCANPEQLRAYLANSLSPAEEEELTRHLKSCTHCHRTLETLERQDPFLGELAAPAEELAFSKEDECRQALSRLEQLRPAGSPASPRPAGTGAPARLDQYELVELLGKGGMGEVWKARHAIMTGQVYALKVIKPGLAHQPEFIERFEREIDALGKLPPHPNLVRAFDTREAEGRRFLVMEYIEGKDLHKHVAERGPLPAEEAVALIRQAARGLQHLHEHGRVHRDIKPSNLLLDNNGVVKVADLGLALLKEVQTGAPHLTVSGQLMGTPGFMPPEQEVDPHRVGPQADVFSLGWTLCYLLGARPPFVDPAESLRGRGVPEPLLAILRRMTDRDPARRYATAAEVIAALDGPCPVATPRASVLAVMGTRGGVGKGTLIHFLAQLLADSGQDVVIIDFDLDNAGSTNHAIEWYQQRNPQFVKTAADHFAPHAQSLGPRTSHTGLGLWDFTPTYLSERQRGRIWLVPALDPDAETLRYNVIANIPPPREPVVLRVTREIIDRAVQDMPSVRFILIDCGAGVNPIYSAAFAAADYGMIVTTPDTAHHKEVNAIAEEHRRRYPSLTQRCVIRTVINKVMSAADRAACKALRPVGFIPFDPQVQRDSHGGKELVGLPGEQDADEDPLNLLGVDYDLGYTEVAQAIHDALARMLSDADRPLLKDQFHRLPWWHEAPTAARAVLASRAFRWRTSLARVAPVLLFAFIALLSALGVPANAEEPTQLGFLSSVIGLARFVLSGLLLGALWWVVRQEKWRMLLRDVAALPQGHDLYQRQDRLLLKLLQETDRKSLRRLHELVTAHEAAGVGASGKRYSAR